MIPLYDHQLDALSRMKNGCILCGGVGSGKSRTSLAYFYQLYGGDVKSKDYTYMKNPPDLYIITTARKRDESDWEAELVPFVMSNNPEGNAYSNKVVIDSWNNVQKYKDVKDSFFIFDEQRVVGDGEWSAAFIAIARKNKWILLSATPGDNWSDYMSVFIANGFYKNKTEYKREHFIYSPYSKFPKIERYIGTGRLYRLREQILIDMDFNRRTIQHHETIRVKYDALAYKEVGKSRWNPYKNQPIENAAELCFTWRRIVNESEDRQIALLRIFEDHPKMIVFYNYKYELEILKNLYYGEDVVVAEWNGRKHEPVPDTDSWVYLVQYTAGAEGWNCIKTDTIVFYSANYSYKIMEQSSGRIDRLNTPYIDLYFYHLMSTASIDLAIDRALRNKKKFNETRYLKRIKFA